MEILREMPRTSGAGAPAPSAPRVAVVAGLGSGIGFAAAAALARQGYALIGVARTESRAAGIRAALEAAVPGLAADPSRLAFAVGDLGRQRDAARIAEEAAALADARFGGRIDRLVYTAGQVTSWYVATEDGYETQFAVNHLACFRLALALRGRLEASGDGRVVVVSSGSHRGARIRWSDPMLRRLYNPLTAYKQSKLANVLFVHAFNARCASERLRAYAVDPGLVDTDIGSKATGVVAWVWRLRRRGGVAPEVGAATVVALASEPAQPRGAFDYWKDGKPERPSAASLRREDTDRLWAASLRLCGMEENAWNR